MEDFILKYGKIYFGIGMLVWWITIVKPFEKKTGRYANTRNPLNILPVLLWPLILFFYFLGNDNSSSTTKSEPKAPLQPLKPSNKPQHNTVHVPEKRNEVGEEVISTPSVAVIPICPRCGDKMRRRNGKYGEFWGCVGFPKCKGTRNI